MENPLISIITVVKNNETFIEHCMHSVFEQTYPNVEYIVIDGASTDGTLEKINTHALKIKIITSEKDTGIYEAINKGIKLSLGEVVGILHSDDYYFDASVLSCVMKMMADKDLAGVYGDLIYVGRDFNNKWKRIWNSGEFNRRKLMNGWMPPHPSLFIRKSIYEKYGLYKEDYRISADYELILRYFLIQKLNFKYLPKILVSMRLGGVSNCSILNRILANIENRRAWRENGLGNGWLAISMKPLRKIGQFLKVFHRHKKKLAKNNWELEI